MAAVRIVTIGTAGSNIPVAPIFSQGQSLGDAPFQPDSEGGFQSCSALPLAAAHSLRSSRPNSRPDLHSMAGANVTGKAAWSYDPLRLLVERKPLFVYVHQGEPNAYPVVSSLLR